MSLRKNDTFHNPVIKNEALWDPLAQSPSAVLRSTTCPKQLEDLLIGAGERRVVDLFNRVDKALETRSKLAVSAVLNAPEVLPDQAAVDGEAAPARNRLRRNSHSSDSGIGSSVADSEVDGAKPTGEQAPACTYPSSRLDTYAKLRADTTPSPPVVEERGLSRYAATKIHEHIIQPILREQQLQEFHPLVKDVPVRIGDKRIKTLRDLEKSLIFLAPDYSRSPAKYLQFCERTIRVLHTTVTTVPLPESDKRAPADRPYTQGYFFDLVEQIRKYATILAATREKQAKGDNLDDMDYTADESVSLIGGVSHNGKAPELVRRRADGKTISLATGLEVPSDDPAASTTTMKRSLADVDDDEVLRSMARRKKGAKPEIHECPLCDKEFKRPCDLTKHIKTHERPFKCPEAQCKYHDYGWPTEKERDRHVNDKHSTAPPLYHCLYKPCPYTSKRESNCKQHMEKAHGWEYVRSKSNGKGKASSSVTRLPFGSVPPSPASAMLTPLTPIAPSPSTQSWSTSSHRESMPPPTGVAGPSNYGTPAITQPSPDFSGHFNMNFNFNDMSMPMTPALSEDRGDSSAASISSHSGLQLDGSSFDDDLDMIENFDFGNFNFAQQPSPVSGPGSAVQRNLSLEQASPGAQLDQTFTSSNYYGGMNVDGYSEDFTLFGGNAQTVSGSGDMFPSLPQEGSSWGNFGANLTNSSSTPHLVTGDSTLAELFPGLVTTNPQESTQ
ncbi:zinc finger protein transcription factor ace1-like [Teratosphaeria destructans]|uniref:Zinc finger protein transcription factor ace1-like n=1 Tax=Teratosphaeria destructans TaxID=418781 RepID=A0A9W7SJR2_9PEZI|nr:zinc finger protein transcription factor ace1-like [Teratosphaeria destructans]